MTKWTPPLHPRDRKGRFTESGASILSAKDQELLADLLGNFKPRQFHSGDEADAYLAHHGGNLDSRQVSAVQAYSDGGQAADINKTLRSSYDSYDDYDSARDDRIDAMRSGFQPTPDDLLLNRTVSTKAFGAALEDLPGYKVHDSGFSSTSLGVSYESSADHVQMHIAVPKGTPALIAGPHTATPGNREVILDAGQEFGVASVTRSDEGDYNMSVVALPGGKPASRESLSFVGRDPAAFNDGDEEAFLAQYSQSENTAEGSQADTRIVTDPATGNKMVYKRTSTTASGSDADQAEAEVLGSLIGEALGAPAPKVWRLSDNAVAMEFVQGETVGKWLADRGLYDPEGQPWMRGKDGDRLAVMDYVTGNRDRNDGNIILKPDGGLVGIDHSFILVNPSFATRGMPLEHDENMTWSAFGRRPWERPGVTLEMLDEIEPKLAGLKDAFDRVGGLGPARHAELMRRTALLRETLEEVF